jgi:hypothetical protein
MRRMLLIFLLFAVDALALELNEELLNVRVLAVHPNNVVIMNRGLEDGVVVGSHARLRGTGGYAARGICVRSGIMASHWRLYRVVDPTLISKDLSYTLVGMDASEVAPQAERYQDFREDKTLPPFDETKLIGAPVAREPGPAASASADLPTDLSQDKDFILKGEKAPSPVSVNDKFDRKQLKQDLRNFTGSLYASPWSVQKGPANVESVRLGARLANEGMKYRLQAGIDQNVLKSGLEKDGENFSMRSTEAFGTFTLTNLSPAWDAYSDVTYREARYGTEQAPKRQYLIAPVGFTYKAAEGVTMKKFELSYAPTYDTRTHEGERLGERFDKSKHVLRHAVRLLFLAQISPEFSVTNDLRWRPAHDLNEGVDFSDNLTLERFLASWRLAGPLHVDYEFQWMDDAQLRRISGLPRVITTNSVNVRLDFSL